MTASKIRQIKNIFKSYPKIKLAYFFGSRAIGNAGPLSDYDFAIYADVKDNKKLFNIKAEVMDKISRLLKTDKVDIVVLNSAESPELKYNIIKEGKLIYEKEPFRVIVEPRILNEYFDFNFMLKKYKLTKV